MTSASAQSDLRAQLEAIMMTHTPAVRSSTSSARAEALAAARKAVLKATEADRQRRESEAQQAGEQASGALASLEQTAEAQRVELAARLCAQAFTDQPGSLKVLVSNWMREPSRAGTKAILDAWRALTEQCQLQLGTEPGLHVLTAAFIDVLLVERPQALAHLAGADNGWPNQHLIAALGCWSSAARDMSIPAAEAALAQIEDVLLSLAHQSELKPTVWHHELCQLRRAHITDNDWRKAQHALLEQQKQADQEAFEKSYRPPAPPAALDKPHVLSWMWGR